MRIVVQRVSEADVHIGGKLKSMIGEGMLILLGIEEGDTLFDSEWLCKKIISLRIFNDDDGIMNRSIMESGGDILLISQFTLTASTRKGNRPSYIRAARQEVATQMYKEFIQCLENLLGKPISCGEFGADMKVRLINDGPVTIIIDSKLRE
jgi:D-tyrosyl-tRNA(Tyr) deacylase